MLQAVQVFLASPTKSRLGNTPAKQFVKIREPLAQASGQHHQQSPHGTLMAGVCLYGSLSKELNSTEPVASHHLTHVLKKN